MKTAKIKESNYWSIFDYVMGRKRPEMQGNKLKALFKLIQKKGVLIETEHEKLKGLKALEINKGEYIAIKRTGPKDSFYPCCLKTYLLTDIKA